MMDYELFREVAEEKIKDYLPESYKNYEVDTKTFDKVNRKKDGLMLKPPGNGMNAAAIIYINDLYEEYKRTEDLENTLKMAASYLSDAELMKGEVIPEMDFDHAKEDIVFMLINWEQNEEMLAGVPHRDFEDLSIIYRLQVDANHDGMRSIMVTTPLAENWGVNEEKLFQLASENTKRLMTPVIRPLGDLLSEIMIENGVPDEIVEMIKEPDPAFPMWIVSNKQNVNGAVSILFEDTLETLAKVFGTDLYVLPSSIHEMLVVSAEKTDVQELASMVYEINMSQVGLEERLSNQVYHYDRDLKKLSLATDTPYKRLDGIAAEAPLISSGGGLSR